MHATTPGAPETATTATWAGGADKSLRCSSTGSMPRKGGLARCRLRDGGASAAIVVRCSPRSVVAVDPSESFLKAAGAAVTDGGVEALGDALQSDLSDPQVFGDIEQMADRAGQPGKRVDRDHIDRAGMVEKLAQFGTMGIQTARRFDEDALAARTSQSIKLKTVVLTIRRNARITDLHPAFPRKTYRDDGLMRRRFCNRILRHRCLGNPRRSRSDCVFLGNDRM